MPSCNKSDFFLLRYKQTTELDCSTFLFLGAADIKY